MHSGRRLTIKRRSSRSGCGSGDGRRAATLVLPPGRPRFATSAAFTLAPGGSSSFATVDCSCRWCGATGGSTDRRASGFIRTPYRECAAFTVRGAYGHLGCERIIGSVRRARSSDGRLRRIQHPLSQPASYRRRHAAEQATRSAHRSTRERCQVLRRRCTRNTTRNRTTRCETGDRLRNRASGRSGIGEAGWATAAGQRGSMHAALPTVMLHSFHGQRCEVRTRTWLANGLLGCAGNGLLGCAGNPPGTTGGGL
jgi:hypothetical protein